VEREKLVAELYKIEWSVVVGKDRIYNDQVTVESFDIQRAVETGQEVAEEAYIEDRVPQNRF
jgi:hypothetical protein